MIGFLRIGEVAQALGVSVDTLRRWDSQGKVQFERRGNQRVLRIDRLRPLLAAQPAATTPHNKVTGTIVGIERGDAVVRVELVSGEHRFRTSMGRESADRLGLVLGGRVTVLVRATIVAVGDLAPRP